MKKEKSSLSPSGTFAENMFALGTRFSVPHVFNDFLTMAIAACTPNPVTGISHYEEEYLATIAPYKDSELRHQFSYAFANLISEMEADRNGPNGGDVLGSFFEEHITHGRNGQFFTPYHVCELLAVINLGSGNPEDEERLSRVLDPACGGGRMLLASARTLGPHHEYYGIDIDLTCVKMTALNLFLNGVWRSEVMCADALLPDDFVISYYISFLPLGIFKIQEKEKSRLWNLHRWPVEPTTQKEQKPFITVSASSGSQLGLF